MTIERLPGGLVGLRHLVPSEKRASDNHSAVVVAIHPLGQEQYERPPRVEAKEPQKKPDNKKRADGVVGSKKRLSRVTHVAWEESWKPFQDKIRLVVEGLH